MLTVLRNRNYALLWVGQLVSVFGDWLLIIALPFAVYDLTGSTLATGALLVAQTLPRVLLASFAGVLVDRWDRRRTMLVTDLLRGAALLVLLVVHSAGAVWVIYAVALANATVGQFFNPAKSALIPRLVTAEQLTAANALDAFSRYLTRLVAPALGGALYGLFGLRAAAGVDAASFAVSAACLALLAPAVGHREDGGAGVPLSIGAALAEWRAGLRLAAGNPTVRGVFAAMGGAMFGGGIMSTCTPAFVHEVLGGGAARWGLVVSAEAIGGIIGSPVFARVGDRLPRAPLIGLSGAIDGLLLLGMFNLSGRLPVPPVAVAAALSACAGATAVGFFVASDSLLQHTVTDAWRGRAFGAYGTVVALATLCGQGIASLLVGRVGAVPTASLGGVAEIIAAALAFALLRRAMPREPDVIPPPLTGLAPTAD